MFTKNRNRIAAKVVAITCSALMATSCGDVVIKVQKKPKPVDASAMASLGDLNLASSEDFLKHLDSLKTVAVDLLIKQLTQRDYRGIVRDAIRNYRKFLIERATSDVKARPGFLAGLPVGDSEDCRKASLSFNMDEANGFLGLILQTGVLAKLSEVSAGKLNAGLSKEMAAIAQIVMMELGLKVEGDVEVEQLEGGMTKTYGSMTIALNAIDGEAVDEATKKADAAEILTIKFERILGAEHVGSFSAAIEMGRIAPGTEAVETLAAAMSVERKLENAKFVHGLSMTLGVKDQAPKYARTMAFEQVDGEKHKLKVTDTVNPGQADEESFVSIIDTKELTQCAVAFGPGGVDGNEGPVDAGATDAGGDDAAADDAGADGTGTEGSGDGSQADDGGDGATTDGGASDGGGKDGGSGGKDGGSGGPGKGDGDDDDVGGKDDGGSTGNNPGQNPGQHPGQHKKN